MAGSTAHAAAEIVGVHQPNTAIRFFVRLRQMLACTGWTPGDHPDRVPHRHGNVVCTTLTNRLMQGTLSMPPSSFTALTEQTCTNACPAWRPTSSSQSNLWIFCNGEVILAPV